MIELRYATAPAGVRAYRDTHAFIAEDPLRQSGWDIPGDIAGWDVADGFRLAEPDVPGGAESEWRICVFDRLVCAVLRRFPRQPLYTFDGPVWVLADVPTCISSDVAGPAIKTLMWEVEQIKREPDSLLLATRMIRICFTVLEAAEQERCEDDSTLGSSHPNPVPDT